MDLRSRKKKIAFCAVACKLSLMVVVFPLAAEITQQPETIPQEQKEKADCEKPKGTLGKAHYYKKSFHKRRTSSGAIYNPQKLTAAHPTLPLGSRVKVVNLANQKSVVVTVNDRCRKHGVELIDLSHAAARELGFLSQGSAQVRILPLEESIQ